MAVCVVDCHYYIQRASSTIAQVLSLLSELCMRARTWRVYARMKGLIYIRVLGAMGLLSEWKIGVLERVYRFCQH